MKVEENKMENTNKKESKLYAFFKDDNPKTLMILNGITAAIWVFITAMNLYSLNTYFTGGLALFYIGMTLGYAIKYRKLKMVEGGEYNDHIA